MSDPNSGDGIKPIPDWSSGPRSCVPMETKFTPLDTFPMGSCGCKSDYCRKCGFQCTKGECGQCNPEDRVEVCACTTYYCKRCLEYIPSNEDGYIGYLPTCIGPYKYKYEPRSRDYERNGRDAQWDVDTEELRTY